ncbi:MAG: 50S ribosomal protein L25 [bacterium]
MSTFALSADIRQVFGRKTKQLRAKGIIPGNIFGKKIKSLAIEINKPGLIEVMRQAGETGLIHLKIKGDDKTHPVLVAGYAQNPVSGEMLHVDFHEVDLTQKTTAMVPVKAVGESPAIAAGNLLVMLKNEIEVEALPTDLPDVIEVDVTGLLEVGAHILAKDLKVDRSKVTLSVEAEEQIVVIQEPAKEPEPVVVAEEAPADESADQPAEAKAEEGAPAKAESEKKPEEPKAEK